MSNNGYVKITDFGIAKIYKEKNASENSGTPGYMAPEVLMNENHSFGVDYFAVGVIGYEFMKGHRPYHGKNRKEIKESILTKEIPLSKEEIPKGWSLESIDCINRLLQRKKLKRLGSRGATEVKEHSWFKYYPWKDLYLQKLKGPFIPPNNDNFDEKYCNSDTIIGLKTIEKYIKIISSSKYKNLFKKFKYFSREETENESKSNNSPKKKKFINPHLVYYESNENPHIDFDASVINRNILNENNIQKEIFSQPRIRALNRISKTRKETFPIQSRNIKELFNIQKFSSYKGENNKYRRSLNLSFVGLKKISKESGFGY